MRSLAAAPAAALILPCVVAGLLLGPSTGNGGTPSGVDAASSARWTVRLNGWGCGRPAVGRDGTVYVHTYPARPPGGGFPQGEPVLHAIDSRGRVKWRLKRRGQSFPLLRPAVGQHAELYAVSARAELLRIAPSGEVMASRDLGPTLKQRIGGWEVTLDDLLVVPGRIYTLGSAFGPTTNVLVALDHRLRTRWDVLLGPRGSAWEESLSWNPARSSVIVATADGELVEVSASQRLSWWLGFGSAEYGYPRGQCSVGRSGRIYCRLPYGVVIACDDRGQEVWRFQMGFPAAQASRTPEELRGLGPPLVRHDGTVIVIMLARFVVALSEDGTRQWTYSLPSGTAAARTPVELADGSVVLSARQIGDSHRGWVYRIAGDGRRAWRAMTDGDVRLAISPDRRTIYLCALELKQGWSVSALDARSWDDVLSRHAD